MAPEGKIGAYTGAYYFFSQLSASLSPVIAGASFGLYKTIFGVAEGRQYILMFPYLIFWEIVAMFFLYKVKRGESKSFTEKQVATLREEYEQED